MQSLLWWRGVRSKAPRFVWTAQKHPLWREVTAHPSRSSSVFMHMCTVDKHNISVLLIHNLKKKIPYNVLSNIFNKIINSYLYGCFFRFQSLGEESVWDWKWPMRLQQKTELRNRRRCGKSLKTSQGEEKVLRHTDWDCKKCLYFAFFSSLISIFLLQIISITIWVKRWMKN